MDEQTTGAPSRYASEPRPAKKRSEPRERLLATASQLFYAEGINSVGVERIIREAHVTLATFYRHFPSKVDLVVAYLQGAHDHIAARAMAQGDKLQGHAARHFVMLRDGAMSAAYLDTPTIATRTFTRGVDGLIRTIDTIP